MEQYQNIIVICLLAIILLICNILYIKSRNSIDFPIKLKSEDITKISAGRSDEDIGISLTEEEIKNLVELNNNIDRQEMICVSDIPADMKMGIAIETKSNMDICIQYNMEDVYFTYKLSEETVYYKILNFNGGMKQFFNDIYSNNVDIKSDDYQKNMI
jgi:hypothetical protein